MSISETMEVRRRLEQLERRLEQLEQQLKNLCDLLNELRAEQEKRKPGRPPSKPD